jgi:8-oxo-dGTP diphosphatase
MSSAFLTFGKELLLMHRAYNRKIAPGMWSAVGGHLEPFELNEPKSACLREIREETGVSADIIKNLNLRYISIRNTSYEIRINYIFFGELEFKPPMIECEEGTLHFIEVDKAIELPMTFSIKEVINHWRNNENLDNIFVATINSDNAHLQWNIL